MRSPSLRKLSTSAKPITRASSSVGLDGPPRSRRPRTSSCRPLARQVHRDLIAHRGEHMRPLLLEGSESDVARPLCATATMKSRSLVIGMPAVAFDWMEERVKGEPGSRRSELLSQIPGRERRRRRLRSPGIGTPIRVPSQSRCPGVLSVLP